MNMNVVFLAFQSNVLNYSYISIEGVSVWGKNPNKAELNQMPPMWQTSNKYPLSVY